MGSANTLLTKPIATSATYWLRKLLSFLFLTPREKDYLRALATLGPGAQRSGDIAEQLRVRVESVAPLRSALIKKGMIYSPAHGDTAFTVPLFDAFMLRMMPTERTKK